MATGSDEHYTHNLHEDDLTALVMQNMSSVPTERIVGNRDAFLAWQMQNQEINGFKDKTDNSWVNVTDGSPQTPTPIPVQESTNYAGSLNSTERKPKNKRKRRKNVSLLNKSQQGKPIMQPSNGDTANLSSVDDVHLRNYSDLEEDSIPLPIPITTPKNNFNRSPRAENVTRNSFHQPVRADIVTSNSFNQSVRIPSFSIPAPENVTRNSFSQPARAENVTSNNFNQSIRLPSNPLHQEMPRGSHGFTVPRSRPHIHARNEAPNQMNHCVGNDNFIGEESSVSHGTRPTSEYDEILAQDLRRNLQMELEQRDAELAQRLEEEERNVFTNDFDVFSRHNNRRFNHAENNTRPFISNRATRGRDNPLLNGRQPLHLQRMYRDGRVRHRTPPMAYPMFLHDHDVFDPEDFVMSAMGMPRDIFGLPFQHMHGFPPQTMDFNDYEALWDLAERIGDAKNNGLSEKALSELKSFKFQDGGDEEESNNCIICLSEFSHGDQITALNCQHRFHKKCIETWLKRKAVCPVCRENIQETKN